MVVRVVSRQLARTARVATRGSSCSNRAGILTQTRSCSLCRSVKEWKENHGAWSRTAKQIATSSSSPSVRRTLAGEQLRTYATHKSLADEKIEEITEAFYTAKDEFDLAWEETEKKTVYAEDDRAAAYEELEKTLDLYRDAMENSPPEIAKEISDRIGQRMRELQAGFDRLDELVQESD